MNGVFLCRVSTLEYWYRVRRRNLRPGAPFADALKAVTIPAARSACPVPSLGPWVPGDNGVAILLRASLPRVAFVLIVAGVYPDGLLGCWDVACCADALLVGVRAIVRAVCDAARHMVNGSAFPHETGVEQFLALSPCPGGCGLLCPVMNVRVAVGGGAVCATCSAIPADPNAALPSSMTVASSTPAPTVSCAMPTGASDWRARALDMHARAAVVPIGTPLLDGLR